MPGARLRIVWVALAFSAAGLPTAAAQTPPVDVPEKTLREIQQQFVPPDQTLAPEEARKVMDRRMQTVLDRGADAEESFPKAGNLHRVQGWMLRAADYFARSRGDAASRKQVLDISRRLLASAAPAAEKLQPDYFLTLDKLTAASPAGAGDASGEIRAFAVRYAKTDAAANAMILATVLARQTRQTKLGDELLDDLEARHAADPRVHGFLRRSGRHPDLGKPFRAKLPVLDGRTLSLPKDLAGRVVVVDFWATWCKPCLAAAPHMKGIYDRHKARGLEIVGVSLDTSKADVERHVRENKIEWTQTFTGQGWQDPTALTYGVVSIPSVWLIGRDGKVISDDAMDRRQGRVSLEQAAAALEQAIRKALAAAPGTEGAGAGP